MSTGLAASGPVRVARARGRVRTAALLAPAVVPIAVVAAGGFLAALAQSLGLMPLVGQPQLSSGAYRGLGPDLWRAAALSLGTAVAATAVALVVGLLTAVVLTGTGRGRGALAALAALTVPVPHVVGAAAVGLLLSDGGLLSRWSGADQHWPALVGGPWPVAVVAEYAWKESAFVALVVTAALSVRATSYLEAAALLGAGRRARLRLVTLPLATPSLLAAGAITFVYTIGSYEVAWLLGRVYPEPLSVMAYRLFTAADLDARPAALAVAVVTTVISLGLVVVVLVVQRRVEARRRGVRVP